MNFNSFCLIIYKTALIKTSFYRVEKICTTEKLEEELMNVATYRNLLTNVKKKSKENKTNVITVNKEPMSMNLNFKGDDVTTTVSRLLNTALARTYPAVTLLILYKTTCSIT
ncbi:unnamed protein product [Schistosoma spindalis]|nr:unnamed protein product [Schistosoma spindale]